MDGNLKLKVATADVKIELEKLSTENLIIWIIGKSNRENIILTFEDLVIECWLINPIKYSLRTYNQFPDSSAIQKHVGAMAGKKGLLKGSMMGGYFLTEISRVKFADIDSQVILRKVVKKKNLKTSDRSISSIDEAPYNRLVKTPAYIKFIENKLEQIVETDFLYFYGINWHSKKSFIQNRFKNIDSVVDSFSQKDFKLLEVKEYLNSKFKSTRQSLINN